MVKTRVHDLAAEFGVAPEQLLSMLKDMNIFVRSHLSALEGDQVSAIRVRWEREKRKSADEPAAKKGRRKAVKAEPAASARRGQAHQAPAHGRRSGSGRGPGAGGEGRGAGGARAGAPDRRARGAGADASRSRSAPARCSRTSRRVPVEPKTTAAPAERGPRPRPRRRRRGRVPAPRDPRAPARRPRRRSFRPASSAPRRRAPRGPKPVSAAARRPPRLGPALAVAARHGRCPTRRRAAARQFGPDAEKGGGRKKGKKGKRSSVDQDAVQANILKTLQGMKGPAGRKGVRRSDEPSYRDVAGRPPGRGARAREDPDPRQRVRLGRPSSPAP